jgi:hypothetical protein
MTLRTFAVELVSVGRDLRLGRAVPVTAGRPPCRTPRLASISAFHTSCFQWLATV